LNSSPGTLANQLQTGGQLIADFGQLLARLLQSVAEILRENTAINQRSKSGQNGGQIGRNERWQTVKVGEKVRKK
jgi:hypothetical protein